MRRKKNKRNKNDTTMRMGAHKVAINRIYMGGKMCGGLVLNDAEKEVGMKIIRRENKLCFSCMEEHEVLTVLVQRRNMIHDTEVEYEAVYEYCEDTDEYTATEEMIRQNDTAVKDAYRRTRGLLTSGEISEIRKGYQISQNDLASVLGWGAKTITRYESFQIQDMAHNDIMVRIGDDPEWFIELLDRSKESLDKMRYERYLQAAKQLYREKVNSYIWKTLISLYSNEEISEDAHGKQELDLEKTGEVMNRIASGEVTALYLVKMMKMLWYSDALCYKRHGHSITGMVYKALSMGAVPIGYQQLLSLGGVHYEEKEFEEGIGYLFHADKGYVPSLLSEEELSCVDSVIKRFRNVNKKEIIRSMHEEDAYKNTPAYGVIDFRETRTLSMD
ncbi:MAG: DUF4065 domain-containing protein [Clostridiales bacterium]|nr:DUF4065 domain-containing protein [Clostridiales bacterium]